MHEFFCAREIFEGEGSVSAVPEKIKPQLLSFLAPSDAPLTILVVESLTYLPDLRTMFPHAELFAVAADGDAFHRPEYAALGVQFTALDYLAEPLPFAHETFDYIISDLTLEPAGNPQDIAAGFSQFLKQTGALLTSFRNIRHWSVLAELMDGHYYHVVARLYAVQEFEKLLYASYYKDVRVRPQRRPAPAGELDRLVAAGFDNLNDDLETEFWLVYAARSMPELSLLKSFFTAAERKELARLLHRIEYDVDTAQQVAAFWQFYHRVGLFPDYTAAFVKEAVFHPAQFYRRLSAHSDAAEQAVVQEIVQAAHDAARSGEEAAMLAALADELAGKEAEP